MCNLYSLTKVSEAVRRLFGIGHNRADAFEPRDAIFPGHSAPVVLVVADGERELRSMSWGFVLPQAGKAPRRVTNARDDKVRTSSFWSQSLAQRRCLVPATSFCEPHDDRTPATWHWFALNGEEPRPMFAFAGIWRHHRGPIRKDGPIVELQTFSFLTTRPNALTMSINHERSPVLLTSETEWRNWLGGTVEEAMSLARPIDAGRLQIVQEGFEKRDLGPPTGSR